MSQKLAVGPNMIISIWNSEERDARIIGEGSGQSVIVTFWTPFITLGTIFHNFRDT